MHSVELRSCNDGEAEPKNLRGSGRALWDACRESMWSSVEGLWSHGSGSGQGGRSNQFLSVDRGRFFLKLVMFPCCFDRTRSEKGIIEECL